MYVLGDSASSQLALVMALSQGQSVPWSNSGSNTTTTAFMITKNAAMYIPDCIFSVSSPCGTYSQNQFSADVFDSVSVGNSGGTGYQNGDIITLVQAGASGGQLQVTNVSGGVVQTGGLSITGTYGTGYFTATNLATTGGHGTGLTVNLTAGENFNGTAFSELSGCTKWNISCGITFDNTYLASPSLWISSANPNVKNVQFMLQSGVNDEVVPVSRNAPYATFSSYSTPMGARSTVSAFAAQGVNVAMPIYTGNHEDMMDSSPPCPTNTFWNCPPQQAQVNFFNGTFTSGTYLSGGSLSGGSAQ